MGLDKVEMWPCMHGNCNSAADFVMTPIGPELGLVSEQAQGNGACSMHLACLLELAAHPGNDEQRKHQVRCLKEWVRDTSRDGELT